VAGRPNAIAFSFLYWSLRRLLELLVLRRRSEREKEIEILLLRHQLRVLEREVGRPQLRQADRPLLAAFTRVLSRRAWRRSAFATPATLLSWHRELVTPAGRIPTACGVRLFGFSRLARPPRVSSLARSATLDLISRRT
jgi:putative transposase